MGKIYLVGFPLLLFFPFVMKAQESKADLAKVAQNPIACMMSFTFQNNTSLDIGPDNRTQNILNIQPVLTILNSTDWQLRPQVVDLFPTSMMEQYHNTG